MMRQCLQNLVPSSVRMPEKLPRYQGEADSKHFSKHVWSESTKLQHYTIIPQVVAKMSGQ
jgi:hypothetical protein